MEIIHLTDNNILIKIDRQIYSLEVIHKCFYWYSDKFSIEINIENNLCVINLSNPKIDWKAENILNKIKMDLIDFKTREIIFKETKNIREILIAKAFANNDDFEEKPSGDISDPIGFNPLDI